MTIQRILVAVLLTLAAPGVSLGQAAPQGTNQPAPASKAKLSACDSFAQAIEQSLKSIDMARGDDIADNSAPRATLSNIKINNQLLLITMNLQLARENSCPARKEPIRTGRYLAAAIQCKTDMLTAEIRREKDAPASCDLLARTSDSPSKGRL